MVVSFIDDNVTYSNFNNIQKSNDRYYCDFDCAKQSQTSTMSLITSIILGADSDVPIDEVKRFLDENNITLDDKKIRKSTIPYVFGNLNK